MSARGPPKLNVVQIHPLEVLGKWVNITKTIFLFIHLFISTTLFLLTYSSNLLMKIQGLSSSSFVPKFVPSLLELISAVLSVHSAKIPWNAAPMHQLYGVGAIIVLNICNSHWHINSVAINITSKPPGVVFTASTRIVCLHDSLGGVAPSVDCWSNVEQLTITRPWAGG